MSDDPKKSHAWHWTAVALIGLPVLYVASFGPACWVVSRTRTGESALPLIYRPLTTFMVIDDFPAELKRRLSTAAGSTTSGAETYTYKFGEMFFYPRGWVIKYASLGAAENWKWRLEIPIEYSPDATARLDQARWKWFRDGK